jgi:hypothetical protein
MKPARIAGDVAARGPASRQQHIHAAAKDRRAAPVK